MKPKKGWKNKPQQNESQQNIQAKPEQAGTIKLKVSTAKEKSKITEFAQTPGYIISTIILSIIGALGGFPVSIQLYSKFFDKPSLNFYPRVLNYNLFEDRDRNQKGTMLRFSGFLWNTGEKPLFVKGVYKLTIETPGFGKRTGSSKLISDFPDTAVSGGLKISYSDSIDMQTISILKPDEPHSCSAIFIFNYLKNDLITKETLYTLECQDLEGKRYMDTFRFGMVRAIGGEALPEIGVKILPIRPDTSLEK